MRLRVLIPIALLATLLFGCDLVSPSETSETDPDCCDQSDPEGARHRAAEDDMLARFNTERQAASDPRPALARDPGMDRVMLWYATNMVKRKAIGHIDENGRDASGRARYYGEDKSIRCSEITQWWSGSPSGRVHYEGYRNSPSHRSAYMEEGIFNLGPTQWAGVAVVSGTGPAGSQFEGRSGSYSGMLLCDRPLVVQVDPFSESD